MLILSRPNSAIFSLMTVHIPSAGSTAVTCAAFLANGMARVPGPAPISSTRDFSVISVSQMVLWILLCSFWHIFQNRRALSRLLQIQAQSLPGLDSRLCFIWLIQTSFQSMSLCGSIITTVYSPHSSSELDQIISIGRTGKDLHPQHPILFSAL